MAPARGAIPRRILPTVILLIAILAVTALWAGGAHAAYFALFRLLGVPAFRFPFLDTHGELAVIDCHRLGFDVYRLNPCDVLGRVHVYTPLWYHLAWLPVTDAATPWVGLGLALLFALSLRLLPAGGRWGTACLVAAALSPATAFALERGNADLLMFVLAALAAWLAARVGPTRLAAYPLIVLAAALKLYPVTQLVLAARESPRRCLLFAGLSVAVLAAYAAFDRVGLREMLRVVPGGSPFLYAFGARNLALGLRLAFHWPHAALAAVQTAALLAAALFAVIRARSLPAAVAALAPAETTALLTGAVLILGCFVLGQSGEYRAVHLLFVLPALTALPTPARRLGLATAGAILLQLWGDLAAGILHIACAIPPGDALGHPAVLLLWLARELLWWWIAAALAAFLLAVLATLPATAALRRGPTL